MTPPYWYSIVSTIFAHGKICPLSVAVVVVVVVVAVVVVVVVVVVKGHIKIAPFKLALPPAPSLIILLVLLLLMLLSQQRLSLIPSNSYF